MPSEALISRRRLLRKGLLGASLLPLIMTGADVARSAQPLLNPDDAAAKKVKYTEDAASAKGVPPDNKCANCALYEGPYGSAQGPCQLFPDKRVVAAGWCSAWSPQM
ncbi:MAG TPA: high-potential iron-sulfur protein [Steroidobacteraceae bacterium]|jgi:hypothetical protein